MMRKILLFALLFTLALSSCKKDTFDAAKQAETDEAAIKAFVAQKGIAAVRHSSGLYYVISTPGTGSSTYTTNTTITAKYSGRLLSGQTFDSSATGISFPLGGVIAGWQIGIPLIQKGGIIRLLIPSGLAYANQANGTIPANSVLDFDVELVNVQN